MLPVKENLWQRKCVKVCKRRTSNGIKINSLTLGFPWKYQYNPNMMRTGERLPGNLFSLIIGHSIDT